MNIIEETKLETDILQAIADPSRKQWKEILLKSTPLSRTDLRFLFRHDQVLTPFMGCEYPGSSPNLPCVSSLLIRLRFLCFPRFNCSHPTLSTVI